MKFTGVKIPLLDVPLAIIEKYQGDKKATKKGV